MATLFRDLPSDQQKNFHDRCQRLGIDAATVRASFSTENGDKTAGSASFPPDQVLVVNSIKDLVSLFRGSAQVGTSLPAAELDYPPPPAELGLPQEAAGERGHTAELLTRQQHLAVAQAMHAWIEGNPHRVRDYEWLINALHFPMRVSVFAAMDVTITASNPLIIPASSGPTHLTFGTVTVEPGGYIESWAPLDMNVQAFTVLGS